MGVLLIGPGGAGAFRFGLEEAADCGDEKGI